MINNKTLKKFGIISTVLFSIVMIVAIYVIQNCSSFGNCSFISSQVVNFIFVLIGAIGLIYCLIIVKGLDDKVDSELIKEYEQITDMDKIKKTIWDKNNGA